MENGRGFLKISKMYISGSTGSHMGQGWHQTSRHYIFFYGNGNADHHL
jgi:hypothetical protein